MFFSKNPLTSQSTSTSLVLFRQMGVLLPSLVLSALALCGTTTKVYVLAYRSYQEKKNELADTVMSWILWLLNVLLLVSSVIPIETVLDVLLLLANGALIIYHVSCLALCEVMLTGVCFLSACGRGSS